MSEPFYYKTELRFKCTGCGRCCFGNPRDHFIELLEGEAERIQQYLDISPSQFKRRFQTEVKGVGAGVKLTRQGQCSLLNEKMQCSIYEVRPRQCQTYPYWSEIFYSEQAWHDEAKRCEGIGCGDVIPIETITNNLEN